ncbi:MAG: class I SAM-dependent methyltransferase [Fibrobacterales bacterium]
MIKNEIKAFDSHAKEYTDRLGDIWLYDQHINAFVETLLPGARIVDLACGPCRISQYMYDTRNDLRFHCIDISPKMIEIAQQKLPKECATFALSDIKEVTFTSQYDGVMCSFGFPFLNLTEIDHLLRKVSLALHVDGSVYISTMQGDTEGFESTSFSGDTQVYFIYHQKNDLDVLFKKHGFSIEYYREQVFPQDHSDDLTDMIYILKKD